jgi:Gluconate 2-dehydrogenase subunit 3
MSEHPGSSKIIPVSPVEQAGPVDSPAPDGIRRREALQALLGTVGAGLALPSIVEAQHPMHQYPPSPAVVQEAQQKAAVAAYAPEFLDAHQLKTLEVLAEAIVPGSTTARVAPFLDQLLAVESAENQRAFLGALGAFDMAASTKHGKAWNAIAATEQDVLLRDVSTADPKSAMQGHFQNLKGWIAGAYYSSEPGMRELGWTGAMIFAEFPGCTHPGGHGV